MIKPSSMTASTMNASLALDQFIAESRDQPERNYDRLLLEAYRFINDGLRESNYAMNDVKVAERIYGFLGDRGLNERVELMRQYLRMNSNGSNEDKFWAKWHLIDNLALLKKYKEMIEEQRSFLRWAKDNMDVVYWIKVMDDSTQALGWFQEKCTEEWFDIYYDLIDRVDPTSANRHRRVLYVETAAGLLVYNLERYGEASQEIERYHSIIHEDPSWHEYKKFLIRVKSYQLGLYSAKREWEKYDEIVDEAMIEIKDSVDQYEQGKNVDLDEICDMNHEIGTCLMWERRYEQAIPLFRYAIENQGTGITHYFYAVCVWAVTKDRTETLHHLNLAEHAVNGNQGLRSRYVHLFLENQEFSEVWDDKEFLSVFNP